MSRVRFESPRACASFALSVESRAARAFRAVPQRDAEKISRAAIAWSSACVIVACSGDLA